MSATRTRTREPDQACAEAVDLARDALAVVGAEVGAHLGVQAEGERIVTHLFESGDPAYTGWRREIAWRMRSRGPAARPARPTSRS